MQNSFSIKTHLIIVQLHVKAELKINTMHHLLVVRLCFRDKKIIYRGYAQQYSFKGSDALDDKQVATDKQYKSAA